MLLDGAEGGDEGGIGEAAFAGIAAAAEGDDAAGCGLCQHRFGQIGFANTGLADDGEGVEVGLGAGNGRLCYFPGGGAADERVGAGWGGSRREWGVGGWGWGELVFLDGVVEGGGFG